MYDSPRVVIDPSDPAQVAEFLTSLGFHQWRCVGPGADVVWGGRWVGPWEPAE
jgi:hypothetical protein